MRKSFRLFWPVIYLAVFIAAGFMIITLSDTSFSRQQMKANAEDVVTLTADVLDSDIKSYVNESITVSKSMASSSFLIDWLHHEQEHLNTDGDQELVEYLRSVQQEWNYDIAFLVSTRSKNYYYQGGISKALEASNPFDSWYYNFVRSSSLYNCQVDHSEATGNKITLFVNYRIVDDRGNMLGVIGVGTSIHKIQRLIAQKENEQNVEIYVVNAGNADNTFTWNTTCFKTADLVEELTGIPEEIISSPARKPYAAWNGNKYQVIINDSRMKWNIIISKDCSAEISEINDHMTNSLFMNLLITFGCIVVCTLLIRSMSHQIHKSENIDSLTGLPNRTLFEEDYQDLLRLHESSNSSFVLIEADHLQNFTNQSVRVRDTVLNIIARVLQEQAGKQGTFARMDTDRFIGIIYMDTHNTCSLIDHINDVLQEEYTSFNVSVCAGVTIALPFIPYVETLKAAEEALYRAKKEGEGSSVAL